METNSLTYGDLYDSYSSSQNNGNHYGWCNGLGHDHSNGNHYGHPHDCPIVPEIEGVFILIPLIIVLLVVEWRKWRKKKCNT